MREKSLFALMLFFFFLQSGFSQGITVKGSVKDTGGQFLPGVSVVVKGTSKGVETNFDGNFTIQTESTSTLVFSYVGMKTQEIKASTKPIIVVLEEEAQELEGVVVVGFGQKRAVKELTGSVGKVGKEIADNTAASIDKALSGRVAGVQGGMATGQPGGAAMLRIRGMASINGRNNPIYIVDGVRVSQGDLSRNTPTSNILANMNEADIESVTVLKDAVSTAVYGADAGAGVIIITTKQGRKGEAKFTASAEAGFSERATKGEEPLSTSEWLGLLYQMEVNSGKVASMQELMNQLGAGVYTNGNLQEFYNNRHINTNWRKETEREAAMLRRFNGSVSGGSERLTYYSSLGYYDQDGVVKNSGFNRVSSSNRIGFKANEKLNLSTDFQVSYSKMYTASDGAAFANPILGQYLLYPTDPVRNADGSYNAGNRSMLSNGNFNIAYLQKLNHIEAKATRMFGNFQADYKIWKSLIYKFTFAPEFVNVEEESYDSPLHGDGYNRGGSMTNFASRYFNFNVQNTLSYDFSVNSKNNFSVLLAQEAYRSDLKSIGAEAENVGNVSLQTLNSFVVPKKTKGYRKVTSRGGYALSFHYDYDKLYLLDVQGRQDKHSSFWAENRTGYFWSAGVGVDFARLDYFKKQNVISQLKLSSSYGRVGNLTDKSPYSTYTYTLNYNDRPGAYPSGVENKNLKWETVSPLNIGLDLGLWNDRLTVGMAYFNKLTKNMVFAVPLSPAQGGYNSSDGGLATRFENVGEMRNSGFEVTLGAKIIENDKKGFNWTLNANLSTLDNKITKLYGGKDIIPSTTRILREGEAANSFYLREWAGVNAQTGAPQWYKKDGSVTSNYNEAERKIIGGPMAKIYGGFDTRLSYRGISLDAQFSFGSGNYIYDSWAFYGVTDGLYTATYPGYKSQLDYWTPQNTSARNPKPLVGGQANSRSASTRYLYKGDYLRMRTLKLAYQLPAEFVKNVGFTSVQIYALGDNLWTHNFDKNFKFDPDMQINGYANAAIPPLRTYSIGVNVNF